MTNGATADPTGAGVDQTARVFICYAHEDAGHKATVYEFAIFLTNQGIDVTFDAWAEGERRDWDLWMRREVDGSDFVLVIASERVRHIGNGSAEAEVEAPGIRSELDLLRELHRTAAWRSRILPVVLPGSSRADIPTFLLPLNADHYVVRDFSVSGAEMLLRLLTGQPRQPRPVLGPPPVLPPEVGRHWVVSARGTDLSPTDFWFTGRRRALDAIEEFTRESGTGVLVVTGMPGAGKSAVLGVCVLRSLAPSTLPPEILDATPDCSIHVAVHARRKDVDTVLGEIVCGLGGVLNSAVDVRDELDRLIAERSTTICVIDAVDEAADPAGVAEAIRWLSGRALAIVGVRQDAPAGVGQAPRLPPQLAVRHPTVIDLDAREHAAARDVAAYVANRLRADTGRPDGYGTGAWDMDLLVDVIGAEIHDEVSAGNFLVAQLVVEEMLDMPILTDRRRGWSAQLHWPRQLREWIGRDVRRRWGGTGGSRARTTLAPVAHALRGGLPVDLWRVLVPLFGTSGDPDKAIGKVLRRLGFYLTSPAPGLYAMRHEQFAGYFADALPVGRGDQIFVDVLLGGVPREEDGRVAWAVADEYTALNLLAHAHAGGGLSAVIDEHPACLARVERLSAVGLLGSVGEPACQAGADALRRAAYMASLEYGQRAAAIQAHAALAGHDDLAAALLAQAGPAMPWSVAWSAGAPDRSPVAVGAAVRCQAVVVVEGGGDDPPSVVLAFPDGTCSLRTAEGGDPLAAEIAIDPVGDESPPVVRAWHTVGGAVQLAVGRSDGHVTVWQVTGGAAGEVIWQHHVGSDLRDLARVAGPKGTDLLVCLASGELLVEPLRPFTSAESPALLRTACTASRVLALKPAGGVSAFLTSGADTDVEAWRVGSGAAAVEHHVHRGLRGDAFVASGDADQAWVLGNTDQIRVTRLDAGLSVAEPAQRLGDGGRTARVALAVHEAGATAAVGDGDGGVQVFRLAPGEPPRVVSEHDTGHPVYHLAFVDQEATTLAVGGWSGDITVLDVRGLDLSAAIRIHHGESSVEVLPLGRTADSALVATRSLAGLTRIWQLPIASSAPGPAHQPVTSLATVPVDEGRTLLAAASTGHGSIRCWLVDAVGRADPLPVITHPGGVAALAGARVGDRALLLSVGESGAILWAVRPDAVVVQARFPRDQPDVEHALLGAGPAEQLVIGTAGPEHLRLWTERGEDLVADEVWVTALVQEQIGDRLIIAVGDDDGLVRLLEFDRDGAPTISTVHEGDPVVAVALQVAGAEVKVAVADRYGGLHVAPVGGIDGVPWLVGHLVSAPGSSGERLFGVAGAPPRVLSWTADSDHLRLDHASLGELRGTPRQVARTELAIAVADGGGRLFLADAAGGWTSSADLTSRSRRLPGCPGRRCSSLLVVAD